VLKLDLSISVDANSLKQAPDAPVLPFSIRRGLGFRVLEVIYTKTHVPKVILRHLTLELVRPFLAIITIRNVSYISIQYFQSITFSTLPLT
jgi:hypothetical protein